MKYVNHLEEIDTYRYLRISKPIGLQGNMFQLIKNGIRYEIPSEYIICYVPSYSYYIEMKKVNKEMKKV